MLPVPYRGAERDPLLPAPGRHLGVVPLGRFDPAKASTTCSARVTSCCFVQLQWNEVVDLPRRQPAAFTFRRIVWGTSAAVIPLLEAMSRVFPGRPDLQLLRPDRDEPVTWCSTPEMFGAKFGSVGPPVLAVEARIVDDEMRDVPRRGGGDRLPGPHRHAGATGACPTPPAEAFAGGWFHSGDLCRPGRRGVHLRRRPQEGHDHLGRGEHLLAEVEAAMVTHPACRGGGHRGAERHPVGRDAGGGGCGPADPGGRRPSATWWSTAESGSPPTRSPPPGGGRRPAPQRRRARSSNPSSARASPG